MIKQTNFQSYIFPKMWQRPITFGGCFNKIRKSSTLFWHRGIAFTLCLSILSSLWRAHPRNWTPNPTFFFFFKEAWTFHDHIRNQSDFTLVMQYVMFLKNVSRLKSAVCSVVVSFSCLLPWRSTQSAQVQQKSKSPELVKTFFWRVVFCHFFVLLFTL